MSRSSHLIEMYKQLYESPKGASYRRSTQSGHEYYFKILDRLCEKINPESILEFGCGYSRIGLKLANKHKAKLTRYDPAIERFSEKPNHPVDIIFSTDVIEHVPLEDIPEIFDYPAKNHFHVISCRRAKMKLPDGSNAHCTVRSESWWGGYLTSRYSRLGFSVKSLPSVVPRTVILFASQ